MPITDELGNLCLAADSDLASAIGNSGFSDGSFETWLSRAAEDQPYLTVAENLKSRSVYAKTTELVARVLAERQNLALASDAPEWLLDLVELWHQEQAAVITFNYDTLVESALKSAAVYDAASNVTVPWPTAINFTPTGRIETTYGEAGQNVDWATFRLLKMHGSLNWYWAPGDQTGATITRGKLPGVFGAPDPMSEESRQRWLPGREPFLVPPAALKSSYYANPITKEIWQQAYRALSVADRIVLMGYSLPSSDLSVAGMITDALGTAHSPTIQIVDLDPSPIQGRLLSIRGDLQLTLSSGRDAISQFAATRRSETLARVPTAVLASAENARSLGVAVSWNEGAMAAAVGVTREGSACVVELEGVGQIWFATREDRSTRPEIVGHVDRPVLTTDELVAALHGSESLIARTADGLELAVFTSTVSDFTGRNSGLGVWFQLICSGRGVPGLVD